MNSPNKDFPPKADTGMLEGKNHPAKPAINAKGSLFNHWYPLAEAATRTVARAAGRAARGTRPTTRVPITPAKKKTMKIYLAQEKTIYKEDQSDGASSKGA